MLQNKSINIALTISVISFIFLLIGLSFLTFENGNIQNLYVFVILFSVALFITSYFVIRYYLRRKFDKLYRTINKIHINPSSNDFSKAEEEVESWVVSKKAEIQNLKANEEFRKEFIGNLAHEIKTPIFSVQGYILTLLEGGLEDETINLKFLKKASKNIDRISEIIKDMDTISRIESNNLKLDVTKIELVNFIKNKFEEVEDLAIKKNITLTINKLDVPEIYVLADKQKISQVFSNLILNSIFYGKNNGETIVSISQRKRKVIIEIKDNGIGIDPSHIPRLFERFYRIEKSRERNKGGSGIGLAIVKHVIEAHGESVEVKSQKEIGTSFIFSLKKG